MVDGFDSVLRKTHSHIAAGRVAAGVPAVNVDAVFQHGAAGQPHAGFVGMPEGCSHAGPPRLALPEGPPGECSFWNWRGGVSAFWDVAVPDPGAARQFQAGAEAWHLGSCIVARLTASAHRMRRTSALIARTGVDHVLLHLQQRGSQVIEVAGHHATVLPGDVCLLDLSRGHAAEATDHDAAMFVLPRGLLAPFWQGQDPPHGRVLRGSGPLGRLLATHLSVLAESAPVLSAQDAAAAGAGTAALAAACCGPAQPGAGEARALAAPALLLAIRRHIESNLDAPDLTAEALTARFGLSRSVLYRMFEPFGGVADYVRRRRLRRAYADLAGSGAQRVRQRITDVSQRYGFENDAVFSRAFRREFGISPREAQSLAGELRLRNCGGDAGAVLRDWVSRL